MEFEALSLVRIVLTNCTWIAGLAVGLKVAERWNKWAGWGVGVGLTLALYAFLFPVIGLIEGKMCQIEPLMEQCHS